MIKTYIITFFLLFFAIYGCGSSSGSRYENESKNEEKKKQAIIEDIEKKDGTNRFDITPYHSTFDFDKGKSNPENIWYGYDTAKILSENSIMTDTTGYRVEVLATDDLEEAKALKSEIYFRVKTDTYIIFDSPFYKVRVGDFISRNSAENESLKLKQLGYQDSRVISDSIQIKQVK